MGEIIRQNKPHIVCLSETKLMNDLYYDGYWSHQTMYQRKGGCWTAAKTNDRLNLVKALGSYLCWTRFTSGGTHV